MILIFNQVKDHLIEFSYCIYVKSDMISLIQKQYLENHDFSCVHVSDNMETIPYILAYTLLHWIL